MASDSSSRSTPGSGGGSDIFATTHWTVVLAAGQRHTPQSDHALEALCRAYWFPLYAYIRRRGYNPTDAEDLTQAFFARFLEKNYLAGLSSERGRFRAFLLASLQHFLANEWDKTQRQKRGGGAEHLSLDWQEADSQFRLAGSSDPSPEKAFDREWALALLERVIQRLREECAAEGKTALFDQLKVFLTSGTGAVPYATPAAALGMDETAVRAAVHRLRKRYRLLLRDEIASTLSDPAQVEEEIRALFAAFA